jgi:hypothetical protein
LERKNATAHLYLGLVFIEQRNKPAAQQQYAILKQLDPAKAQQLFDAAPPSMRN